MGLGGGGGRGVGLGGQGGCEHEELKFLVKFQKKKIGGGGRVGGGGSGWTGGVRVDVYEELKFL